MEQLSEAIVRNNNHAGGKRLKPGSNRPAVIIGIITGIIAVLAAAYLAVCAYADSLDTFYPNYHINGIDMSGLTVAEAQKKLETDLLAQGIEITNDTLDIQFTISMSDLGYTAADFAGDAQFWMGTQQSESFLQKGWSFTAFLIGKYPGGTHWPDMDQETLGTTAAFLADFFSEAPIHSSYELLSDAIALTRAKDGRTIRKSAIFTMLADIVTYSKTGYQIQLSNEIIPATTLTAQEIYNEVSGEMKNAGYDIETGSIVPEKIGVEFDASAAQAALDSAQPGETVSIPATVEFPTVTAEELEKVLFRDVLGEARTHVSGTAARIGNVKLSASSITEYVMNTGDVFSYNEAVGQRTAENGYQPAPAYVKGETVDEIGGGICQTSSTLYLACLRANLAITERYAHRYVPAYIAKGMDATVSWGGPDYKFTNNTDYPIKIVTEYKNNYLTVKLLGTNISGIAAKMTFEQLSTTPWETVYEADDTLAPGTETVKTTPYTGYKVKTYRHLYGADGKWISTAYEATSDYKARNQVILRPSAELPGTIPVIETTDIPVVELEDIPVAAPGDVSPENPEQLLELPVHLPQEMSPQSAAALLLPQEPAVPAV